MHGANRLASNSLLEGLVFARRIADDIAARTCRPRPSRCRDRTPSGWVVDAGDRATPLQQAMTRGAGVLRSADVAGRDGRRRSTSSARPGPRRAPPTWEATNLVTVASALVAAALRREETRGCHWREDFPEARDAWLGHLLAAIGAGRTHRPRTWEPR